jgi:hypothetical protein
MKYPTTYMKDVRLYQERKEAKVIPSINENRFSAFGVISKMLEDMLGKIAWKNISQILGVSLQTS